MRLDTPKFNNFALCMPQDKVIQLDVRQVLSGKLGARSRYVPSFLVKWLENIIHQDELNALLKSNYPRRGAEFCEGVLSDLDVKVSISNPELLPPADRRRIIIVCNHPLGGLDGMALIQELSHVYGHDLRFIVNDLLMAVKPLGDVFLPINKHGRQDRSAIANINAVMASDAPVVIFPAGLVSRKGKDGQIRDLRWNKMFVNKAVEYQRDVLPIFFSGQNSSFFYNFARWRKRLGIKFNIEMVCLPGEVFKSRGKVFSIAVGDIIPWQSLRTGGEALAQAQEIRDIVYSLNSNQSQS